MSDGMMNHIKTHDVHVAALKRFADVLQRKGYFESYERVRRDESIEPPYYWRVHGKLYPERGFSRHAEFTDVEFQAFLLGLALAHQSQTGTSLLVEADVHWTLGGTWILSGGAWHKDPD